MTNFRKHGNKQIHTVPIFCKALLLESSIVASETIPVRNPIVWMQGKPLLCLGISPLQLTVIIGIVHFVFHKTISDMSCGDDVFDWLPSYFCDSHCYTTEEFHNSMISTVHSLFHESTVTGCTMPGRHAQLLLMPCFSEYSPQCHA